MCIRRNEAFQSNSRRIQEFANLEGFLTIAIINALRCTKTRKGLRHFFQTLPPAGRRFPTDEREHHSYRLVIEYVFSLRLSSIALYNILHLPRPRVRIE